MTGEQRIAPRAGASDGTTSLSWKVVTTANCSFSMPFETGPIAIWNDTVGSPITATVEAIWGGGSLPLDSECFLEVEYLGTAASPLATLVNDGTANLLATPAAQTASSATWSAFPPASWNPSDKAASVTLSSGNLVATSDLSASYGNARVTKSVVAGKAYFELTSTFAAPSGTNLGLANAAASLVSSSGTNVATCLIANFCQVYINGTDKGFLSPFANFINGDVLCVALDLTNKMVWFRRNGNVWNAGGSADPATNVGGWDVSTLFTGASAFPFVQFSNTSAVNNVRFNGGASAFAQTIPGGFVAWNSVVVEVPFSLSTTLTPALPGWLYARIKCARPSSTFYIDPVVTLAPYVPPVLGPPLNAIAGLTGAWSMSRDMLTAFAGGTRYTKTGTQIVTLEDQSGNNRDFVDSGLPVDRPIEATAFPAGVLCADFELHSMTNVAISNFITASSGAMVISVIVDVVTFNNSTSYNNHTIMADNLTYMGLFARNLSGLTLQAYNWDGSEDAPAVTGTVGTAYVLMWRHHGGNIYASINGGAEVSVASGNTSDLTGLLKVGNRGGGGNSCNCKIAEAFTTSDGSQTAALATAIANMKTWVGA